MKKMLLFAVLALLPFGAAQTGGDVTGGNMTGGMTGGDVPGSITGADMTGGEMMPQTMQPGVQSAVQPGLQTGMQPMNTSTVRGTLDLFAEGLSNVTVGGVVQNIEGWQARLRAAEDAQLALIAAELEELKAELQSGSVDRAAVSTLLSSLGEQTVAAADAASPGLQDRLTVLGAFLQDLGEVAQAQPAPQPTAAIPVVPPTIPATAALLQSNVAQVPLVVSLINIAGWQQRLQGLGDPALEPIAETLSTLQSQLQAETPDQGALSETLDTLAAQTLTVAQTAGPGLSDSLTRFAALLEGLGQ